MVDTCSLHDMLFTLGKALGPVWNFSWRMPKVQCQVQRVVIGPDFATGEVKVWPQQHYALNHFRIFILICIIGALSVVELPWPAMNRPTWSSCLLLKDPANIEVTGVCALRVGVFFVLNGAALAGWSALPLVCVDQGNHLQWAPWS